MQHAPQVVGYHLATPPQRIHASETYVWLSKERQAGKRGCWPALQIATNCFGSYLLSVMHWLSPGCAVTSHSCMSMRPRWFSVTTWSMLMTCSNSSSRSSWPVRIVECVREGVHTALQADECFKTAAAAPQHAVHFYIFTPW
jgi:hypothetical protein